MATKKAKPTPKAKPKARKPKFSRQEHQAFKIFFDKGPVNRETSKQEVAGAFHSIKLYFTTEERSRLYAAMFHAWIGEGRKEWNGVCKAVKARLGLTA